LRYSHHLGDGDLRISEPLQHALTSRRIERVVAELERRGITKTEFDLLELLLVNAKIVVTRDTIYERIWGYEFETSSKSLDVYIGYLRRKTEADGEPRVIRTIRGVGYTLRSA
jgi:two-component system response regulator MprA